MLLGHNGPQIHWIFTNSNKWQQLIQFCVIHCWVLTLSTALTMSKLFNLLVIWRKILIKSNCTTNYEKLLYLIYDSEEKLKLLCYDWLVYVWYFWRFYMEFYAEKGGLNERGVRPQALSNWVLNQYSVGFNVSLIQVING